MKNNVIVYDSMFGNTEKIALGMAKILNGKAIKVSDVKPEDLNGVTRLIVGTPTQGGRPTAAILNWIESVPAESLKMKRIAVFDTRMAIDEHGLFLKWLMKTIGFAAEKMAAKFEKKGFKPIDNAGGFIVGGKSGPLKDGEMKRAMDLAKNLD